MKTQAQASHTPWKQHETEGKIYASIRDATNNFVADLGSRSDATAQANARHIVHCVNMHAELTSTLEAVAENLNAIAEQENIPEKLQELSRAIRHFLSDRQV